MVQTMFAVESRHSFTSASLRSLPSGCEKARRSCTMWRMRSDPSSDSRTALRAVLEQVVGVQLRRRPRRAAPRLASPPRGSPSRTALRSPCTSSKTRARSCDVLPELEQVRVDEAHRVVDLVRDARRELPDRRHLLRLEHLALELLDLRQILEDHDGARGARRRRRRAARRRCRSARARPSPARSGPRRRGSARRRAACARRGVRGARRRTSATGSRPRSASGGAPRMRSAAGFA